MQGCSCIVGLRHWFKGLPRSTTQTSHDEGRGQDQRQDDASKIHPADVPLPAKDGQEVLSKRQQKKQVMRESRQERKGMKKAQKKKKTLSCRYVASGP
mmetsp:Transcript_6945/g.5529  ORF Transcript_6945/g.5529 Transcript_6945/m.5529 type:complete len:98 (-) Transcript_6945:218-511(-)